MQKYRYVRGRREDFEGEEEWENIISDTAFKALKGIGGTDLGYNTSGEVGRNKSGKEVKSFKVAETREALRALTRPA